MFIFTFVLKFTINILKSSYIFTTVVHRFFCCFVCLAWLSFCHFSLNSGAWVIFIFFLFFNFTSLKDKISKCFWEHIPWVRKDRKAEESLKGPYDTSVNQMPSLLHEFLYRAIIFFKNFYKVLIIYDQY